jgi:hypothetical protein
MQKLLIFIFLFSSVQSVFSWGSHYLVMDNLLKHPSMSFAQKTVKVETLDSFLKVEATQVKVLFDEYYSWLEKTGSKRFKRQTFDISNPSTTTFLKTARLNPETKIALVNRVLPGQANRFPKVDVASFNPYEAGGTRFILYEDVTNQTVTVHSILSTFSDEPDWGMDLNLWKNEEYGFGKQPYGKPEGTSSQAPFHITYWHENYIIQKTVPQLTQGMSLERIELFARLSKLAKKTGHEYWAYRFAAWAIHYIEDLCQPYHSNAIPFANWTYYVAFILSPHKQQIKEKATQLIANRHFAYEDFVALGLEKSYTTTSPLYTNLAGYLYKGDAYLGEDASQSFESLMLYITKFSFDHGEVLDKTLRTTFGKRLTEDPSFDFETEYKQGRFNMEAFLHTLKKEQRDKLLEETGRDFEMTGRATRTVLKMLELN